MNSQLPPFREFRGPAFRSPNDGERERAFALSNAKFMSRVYGWMAAGLGFSAVVAYLTASNPSLSETIVANPILRMGLLFAQLGLVLALSGLASRLSPLAASAMFFIYAGLTGLSLSILFMVFTTTSLAGTFFVTATAFAGLSGFGLLTKRDLGPLGSFCMMSLFGLIILGFALMFFPSFAAGAGGALYGVAGILIFSGLTAYDTQRIKEMNMGGDLEADHSKKMAIVGALILYLDFLNLFLKLLQFFGRKR